MFKTSYKILSGVLLFIYMIWLSAININEIDYEPYMKKIWVIKDLKDDHFFYSNHYVLSFFITKIEEGVIEGEFGIGYIPWPTFYNRYFKSSSVTEERFKGKVFNNTAQNPASRPGPEPSGRPFPPRGRGPGRGSAAPTGGSSGASRRPGAGSAVPRR